MSVEQAYLMLEDGTIFEGRSLGAKGTVYGELIFTTGMTGCVESLTDPGHYGQILLFTFPQIGSHGIPLSDRESLCCHPRGVVVRDHCEAPSNFRCDKTLEAFLKGQGIVGISGLDTRALVQLIREAGVMGAVLTTEPLDSLSFDPALCRVTGGVAAVSTPQIQVLRPAETPRLSVALLDYGVKTTLVRELLAHGCQVTLLPYDTPAREVLALCPDGILLSGGPGDPRDNAFCIAQIKALMGQAPLLGLGLGHQMMALAQGAEVFRLKFGHHGANQPVKDLVTGALFITSQNHNYAVSPDSLADTLGALRCTNVNDGSCEAVDYPDLRAFSMQCYPAAYGEPPFALDRLFAMMEGQ